MGGRPAAQERAATRAGDEGGGARAVVYGAYGYTGRLVVARALETGLRPVLAGRNRAELEALAAASGLEWRAFGLERAAELEAGLEGARAVLHCAGPFIHTSRPMADACLRAGVHYLDVTGEITVLEALADRDGEARAAGVALLPGVGFDVVPTDCLAAHLVRRLPSAERLVLAFRSTGGVSRGTALSALGQLGRTRTVRRGDDRVRIRLGRTRQVDFGRGPRTVVSIPWGDLATAPVSTGVREVEVYSAVPAAGRLALRAARMLGPVLRSASVRAMAAAWIRGRIRGPDEAARERGASVVWGEVTDGAGRRAAGRLHGPEGYTFTALAAVAALSHVLSWEPEPRPREDERSAAAGERRADGRRSGFLTPSLAFGPDFPLELGGVRREDLA